MTVDWTEHTYDRFEKLMATLPEARARILFKHVQNIHFAFRTDPKACGESRNPDERLWYAGLLAIYFRIKDNGDVVVRNIRLNEKAWPDYESL